MKFFRSKWFVITLIAVLVLLVAAGGILWHFVFKQKTVVNSYSDPEQTISYLGVRYNEFDDETKTVTLSLFEDGEGERIISENVKDYSWCIYNNNERILYVEDECLFLKNKDEESVKISDRIGSYSYYFSNDGKYIVFERNGNGDSLELYIYDIENGEKEKIASDSDYYSCEFSDDNMSLMYNNSDDELYIKRFNENEERIDTDVLYFDYVNEEVYTYYNSSNSKLYVKYANEEDAVKIDGDDIERMELIANGHAMLYLCDVNYDYGYGELYLSTNEEEIKIESSVNKYFVAPDYSFIYYLNDDGKLYKKNLPKITENSVKNSEKLKSELKDAEKQQIASSVEWFQTSPSGDKIMYNDENSVYIIKDGNKQKIADGNCQYELFENSFVFLGEDGKFYRNSNANEIDSVVKNTECVGENIDNYATSKYGDYVVFSDSENDFIYSIHRDNGTLYKTENCDEYNQIWCYGSDLYSRKLKFSDIVGNYSFEYNGETVIGSIREDQTVVNYVDGEIDHVLNIEYELDNEYFIYLSDDTGRISFGLLEDGTASISSEYYERHYDVQVLSDEKLQEAIEEQKNAAKREEAMEKAREYYYNDIVLSGEYEFYQKAKDTYSKYKNADTG
ncbi:MAG: hypothetical protein Q4B31_00825, partial [Clostridia bacterium]|nr:hypothetical protein [Clostridia bacterium]